MDELIKLAKTYRLTDAIDQRLRLAEEIFQHIEPKLRVFVFSSVTPDHAPDVLQETLKAVATNLRKFHGDTQSEFWGWCYGIARNKLKDHFRKRGADRLQPMPEEELRQLVDSSATMIAFAPGERTDLEYAMKLLTSAKPECYALLWAHYVQGFDYGEIAEDNALTYDAARMQIGRCLHLAQSLVA